MLRSTVLRLAVGYAALFAGSALLLAGYIYWTTERYFVRQTEKTVVASADALLEPLREVGARPEVVAIGEMGLDYHYMHSEREVQQAAFRAQLRAILRASAYGRVRILIPMVAHLSEVKMTMEALARARRPDWQTPSGLVR